MIFIDADHPSKKQNNNMTLKTMLLQILAFSAATGFAQTTAQTGIDKANMDLSVKPGNDFYQYAAGGWIKRHPLTPEFSRYSQFDELQENNQKQLREMIEQFANNTYPQGSLQQKIGSLYRLSMDSVRRNREGYTPIKGKLAEIEKIADRKSVQYHAARLSSEGVSTFFGFGCDADLKDSQWNLMQVNQGGLSMGERDYYLSDEEATKKVREGYKAYVKKLFLMTGCDEATAQKRMEAVLNIETRIAKASYSATKLRDVEGNYHKMSYQQLLADYPGIDWSTLFLLNGVPAFESISVNQPEPIHEVEKILAESSIEDLKAYLYFKLVDDATGALSDDFRKESFNFYGHIMSGAEQDRPRWKRGVSAVESVLGMAVGKMYVEKYFPESSKKRMTELVRNLQIALGQRIDQQKWMSEATKKQAHDKLDAFYVKIGYPDTWMSYDALDINDSLSYYENLTKATQFMSRYYIEKRVNKKTDKTEWLMTPQTINAYYNPTTNEICFPAAILQPPFYNPDADDAVNYGAIGVVISHEMTHGFDDKGRLYDADGMLKDWWTAKDAEGFKERADMYANFFNNIKVLPDLNANGEFTLGENLADHGGLQLAFTAYKNATAEKPLKQKDGFTADQRFFIAYAGVWGQNITEKEIRNRVKRDPHSLGKWRVNGALPHVDAWYEAFGVKEDDKLFIPKANRLDLW